MINLKTVKFIKLLNDLAEKSKNGIDRFENATDEKELENKIFYTTNPKTHNCGVVSDVIIDKNHHDVVSFIVSDEYSVSVVADSDENEKFILVKLFENDIDIVIENGRWDFA